MTSYLNLNAKFIIIHCLGQVGTATLGNWPKLPHVCPILPQAWPNRPQEVIHLFVRNLPFLTVIFKTNWCKTFVVVGHWTLQKWPRVYECFNMISYQWPRVHERFNTISYQWPCVHECFNMNSYQGPRVYECFNMISYQGPRVHERFNTISYQEPHVHESFNMISYQEPRVHECFNMNSYQWLCVHECFNTISYQWLRVHECFNTISYQGPRVHECFNTISYQGPRVHECVNTISYQGPRVHECFNTISYQQCLLGSGCSCWWIFFFLPCVVIDIAAVEWLSWLSGLCSDMGLIFIFSETDAVMVRTYKAKTNRKQVDDNTVKQAVDAEGQYVQQHNHLALQGKLSGVLSSRKLMWSISKQMTQNSKQDRYSHQLKKMNLSSIPLKQAELAFLWIQRLSHDWRFSLQIQTTRHFHLAGTTMEWLGKTGSMAFWNVMKRLASELQKRQA